MIHGGLCTAVLMIHSGLCLFFYHIGMVPAHMSTPMPYNTSLHQVTVGPVPGGLQEVIYSGKHNGIYIYLARILRWVGHPCPCPYSSAQWDLHLPGSQPQVSWPPLSLSLFFSTVGSTSTWFASSGELATPVPTLQHSGIYIYLAHILRWVGHPCPSPYSSAQWDLHLPGLHPQVSWPPLSLSLLFSTVGSTSTWLASSGELATPVPVPTLQHSGIYIYLAHILRWVGHPYPFPCSSAHWDLHLPCLHPKVT